jgi:branched-chain amino acid transport system substrate-binding protein
LWDKDVTYTILLADYFKTRFTASGGTLVLEDQYDDKATDFAAQIAKVKVLPQQPDFYFISAMPYNVGPAVKQFRAAGLTGPIMGGDGYDTPDLVSVVGAASNHVYFTTHALMDAQSGTDGIKQFIVAYNKAYGHDPENAFAALGYDTMYLIADAIKRAGSTDPHAILQGIQATQDFPGITGKISYPNGTHVPQKGVTVIAIKDGKFTLGAELVPAQVPAP